MNETFNHRGSYEKGNLVIDGVPYVVDIGRTCQRPTENVGST
jgi:hypothetical protein